MIRQSYLFGRSGPGPGPGLGPGLGPGPGPGPGQGPGPGPGPEPGPGPGHGSRPGLGHGLRSMKIGRKNHSSSTWLATTNPQSTIMPRISRIPSVGTQFMNTIMPQARHLA